MSMLDIVSGGLWTDEAQVAAGGSTDTSGTATTGGTSDIPILDLFMGRGEYEIFDIPLSALEPDTGAARDLTTYADVIFTVKAQLSDADPGVFQKRKGAGAGTVGVLRVDPTGAGAKNVFRVWINPADTLTLQSGYPSHLRWSARGILATGNVQDLMGGWFDVGIGATQAVA